MGHEATRSGAPILLLNFIRWLRRETGYGASVLLARGGEMEAEYRALAPTSSLGGRAWEGVARAAEAGRVGAAGARLWRGLERRRWRSAAARAGGHDVVYANSILAADALRHLEPVGKPVLCHVHEMDFAFRRTLSAERAERAVARVDRFLACSEAVREYLVGCRGVAAERVVTVYESIPTDETAGPAEAAEVRRALGIPEGAVVVGGVGAAGWRKGTDVFLQVAAAVRRRWPDVPAYFVWLGVPREGSARVELEHDAKRMGIDGRVRLAAGVSDPRAYFAAFDVFALTSREDPFPLVCLEAGAHGVPTVCFAGAGGMPEFVEPDAGVVVPYLSVERMAEATHALLADPDRRRRMGEVARQRVRTRHDMRVVAPRMLDVIKGMMDLGR